MQPLTSPIELLFQQCCMFSYVIGYISEMKNIPKCSQDICDLFQMYLHQDILKQFFRHYVLTTMH